MAKATGRRRADVRRVWQRLRKAFGPMQAPRRLDPLSELIYTILSQNTSDTNSWRAFERLRAKYKDWNQLRRAPVAQIAATIAVAGLSKQKAPRIKQIVNDIWDQHGTLSLACLERMDVEEAKAYLSEFSGVGPKTIACVLLFACGKPVLPVDTHVYRVSRRLQLIGAKTTVVKAHEVLGSIVPSELVLEFHLQLIKLGRTICLARSPRCDACPLADICPTATGARWS